MTLLPISAFLICQDEEDVIEACIRSVSMCAEIIVVDSGSTDRTLNIITALTDEGLPIRLFQEPWREYGVQKQSALEKCTQKWGFSIDSDERVSPKLASALLEAVEQDNIKVWRITRYDYLLGYGYVPPAAHERYHIRLFQIGHAWFDPTDIVHEGMRIKGDAHKLKPGRLLHFRPLEIGEKFAKENKYSGLKADMRDRDGHAPKPWKMIVSPFFCFFRQFIGQGLWRCGWAGFIHSAKGAVYSFLTEAKRWEARAIRNTPIAEPKATDDY